MFKMTSNLKRFTMKSVEYARSYSQIYFDRKAKLQHRENICKSQDFGIYQYIHKEIGSQIADRVFDIKRNFDLMVELSAATGHVSQHITKDAVKSIVICDSSEECLNRVTLPQGIDVKKLIADDEEIPFEAKSVDILAASLSLHWVNKLPETFKKIQNCLKPDGVFIGAMFGGQTLFELRVSLQLAEMERVGGISPHISPFIEPADVGALLQRSGFNMLTIDYDDIIINYPSMFELMHDLKGMGENNASLKRPLTLKKDVMLAAASIYKQLYGNEDGSVPATYQILNFIGWKPDPSQPKPAPRGSAEISMKDISKLVNSVEDKKL